MDLLRARTFRSLMVFALALATMVVVGSPAARAATCQTVPVTTPGSTFTVAGNTVRVPSVSNPRICVTAATVPFVDVVAGGAGCSVGCETVYLRGDVDVGSLSVSYTSDGVTTTQTVDPSSVDNPVDGACLISVGSPAAPAPSCTISFSLDSIQDLIDIINGVIAFVEETAGGVGDLVCNTIPDEYDQSSGTTAHFCDNPVGWAGAVERALEDYADRTSDEVIATVSELVGPCHIGSIYLC